MVSTPRPRINWDSKTLTGQPFYYFAYGAAISEVVAGHADRRMAFATRRYRSTTRAQIDQPIARYRSGGGRLRARHGLAHDRRTLSGTRDGPPDDTRAIHLQDSIGERYSCRDEREALREPERRADRVPFKGRRRAAAAARVFGVARDSRGHRVTAPDSIDAPVLRAPATPESILNALDAQASKQVVDTLVAEAPGLKSSDRSSSLDDYGMT